MPGLAPLFDQKPPLEHHVFRDLQDALLERRPNFMRQPVVQLRALSRVGDELNAEPDFGKGDRADKEVIEWLSRDERHDFGLGSRATQLGENVGVEQPTRHRLTSRTGIRARLGSMSMSRWGDAWTAATSASPVRSPLRRRNSSAASTTTSSRP